MKFRLFIASFACVFSLMWGVHGQEWLRPEIDAFAYDDSLNGVTHGGILFLGSSSIRMWDGLEGYFPGYPVVKRGFGGSSLRDAIYYYDILVRPHNPKQMIVYFGDNDLSNDYYDVDMYMRDVGCFVRMTEIIFPRAQICFISTKPSPSRRKYFPKIKEANRRLAEFCSLAPHLSFIDVWSDMADERDMLRDNSTFVSDSLHLSPAGYRLWRDAIVPFLEK